MKKMKKRFLALLLIFLFALSLTVPAFALTSAVEPNPGEQSFSFMYFGDIQVVENAQSDFDVWGELAKAAVAKNPGLAFILQGGDIVESGINQNEWGNFLRNANASLGDIPFFPTNGNHESNFLSGKPELYLIMFDLPQNGPEGFKGEFYSFDYGNTHVVILNSWVFSGEQKLTDADLARLDKWVLDDLAASNAAFKIMVTHLPIYPVHSDTAANKMREHWAKLFERGGLDVAFVGHQHVYSRLQPMTGGAPDYTDGVTQIMGNAGRKFYDSADETYAVSTIYNVSNYQVARVDGKSMTVETYDIDGNLLDFVSLRARETKVTRLAYIQTLWEISGSPSANAHPFSDVPADNTALAWAYETGLIYGCGDGKFSPDAAITGAQIEIISSRTKITRLSYIETLWKSAGSPSAKLHPFSDVAADNTALAWAYETGLVYGTGDGKFSPDDAITGEQIEIIASRMEKTA
jgi:hypothetical protein